jgi:hypothetical protein
MNGRAFMVEAARYKLPRLLEEWQWLLPGHHTPLFISVLGDWVFGAPDGSLWCLSILEGDYTKIAANAAEYDTLNKSEEWMNRTFIADWQDMAFEQGLHPSEAQCIGWKLHPLLGGRLDPTNLQLFDMAAYQSLMGQLHRQLNRHTGGMR